MKENWVGGRQLVDYEESEEIQNVPKDKEGERI